MKNLTHTPIPVIDRTPGRIKIRTQEKEPFLFFFKKRKVVEYNIYSDGFMGVDFQRVNCPPGEFHMGGSGSNKRETVKFLMNYWQGELIGDQSILEIPCVSG